MWWFRGGFVVFLWYSALRGRGTFGTPPYGVRGSQIPQRVLWYFASTRGKVFTTGFAKSGRFQKKLQQNVSEALFKNYLKPPRKIISKNPFKFASTIHTKLFSEIHSIKFQRFVSGIFFPKFTQCSFGMKSIQPLQPVHEDIGPFARTMSTPSTSSGKN